MEFPDPVIEIAVEPKTKGDQEKLGVALSRLAAEDPSFRVSTDPESGQTILKGWASCISTSRSTFSSGPTRSTSNVGAPQVAYRETITRSVTHAYTHKKQSGGSGQFAHIEIEVSPSGVGNGNNFESKIVGGTVPKEYIPGVEKGVESVLTSGPLIASRWSTCRWCWSTASTMTSTPRRSPSRSPAGPVSARR